MDGSHTDRHLIRLTAYLWMIERQRLLGLISPPAWRDALRKALNHYEDRCLVDQEINTENKHE